MKISKLMAQRALKKAVSVAVVAGIAVSMAACSAKQTETESQIDDRIEPTTRVTESMDNRGGNEPNQSIASTVGSSESTTESTTEETTTEETSASSSQTTTAKAIGKTTVTTASKKTVKISEKHTNRIPKVNIAGVNTDAVNKEINNYCKSFFKYDYVDYSYYIGKTYVSIYIDAGWNDGGGTERAFNISRKTGKKLSRAQMLKELGISSKKFNSRVKKAIKKYFKGSLSPKSKDYKKAISSKTLKKTTPYVNSKGKLCFITSIIDPLDGYGADHIFGTC